MNSPEILKTLVVSTSHMPSPTPDFGNLNAAEREEGYFVPFSFDMTLQEFNNLPCWIKPVILLALKHDCCIIEFDRDADIFSGFIHVYSEDSDYLPIYDW